MMEEKEKSEGSKLIAAFMDLYVPESKKYVEHFKYPKGYEKYSFTDMTLDINDLSFDSSWEWLMMVVDKINGMGKEFNVAIFKHYVSITVEKGGNFFYKDFSYAHSEYITSEQSSKQAIFKALVRFIKWYNEKNNPIVVICVSCKEFYLAPKERCTCGSTTFSVTDKSNITKVKQS